MNKRGDILAYKYRNKGYIPVKILAISQLEEKRLYHLMFFRGIFEDTASININELELFIPHVAITEKVFKEENMKKIGEQKVYYDEELRYKNWLTEWNHKSGEYFDIPIIDILNKILNQSEIN
ncbi:MAG: hypothetical protein FXF47_01260 [Candidatus Mcinerneyibacterium aminivorans]|uniref:Uncharacterized protein n=1 Tax=Candidatus Mcinerneyibacterium aminivorans TaxID=2703815 RepID=A0A5D0MG33_9BACT|nr:MAG: hypothetical protein FXF47_01260 [Candidatus Mcinerneyibacterium aminivorans]